MAGIASAITSGVGSLLGGIFGSGASRGASKQAVQGDTNAINTLQAQEVATQGQLSPYLTAGSFGVNQLIAGLSPGGQFTQTLTPDQILAQDPGYNFQLQQGEQQVQRAAAANGTGISGGELKDATTYSQNLAENAYQQAFNNFNQTQNQNFSRLLGITGIGQTAADLQTTTNAGLAEGVAGLYQNEGQAQAAGTLGSANSINSMISGLTGAIGSGISASQLGASSAAPTATASTAATLGLSTPSASTVPGSSSPVTTPVGVNYGDMVGLGASSVTNGAPNSTSLPFGY